MPIDFAAFAEMTRAYTNAWNSGAPQAVSEFFAPDGQIIINNGDPWDGRARIADMAAGFFADVPDLSLVCDDFRLSANHGVYVWTFTGHDATTKNPLNIRGWEE